MTDIDKYIEQLKSRDKYVRYYACDELRLASHLPEKAILALQETVNDSDPLVVEAAQRALTVHAPELAPAVVREELQSKINWLLVKAGSGAIISIMVTTVAAGYFERGCTNSNYMGNLFFIFIVSWIAWVGISSLLRGKGVSSNLAGMLLSLFVILLGAFPCISLIGFWIAPVCN